jgi:hypothetical protein
MASTLNQILGIKEEADNKQSAPATVQQPTFATAGTPAVKAPQITQTTAPKVEASPVVAPEAKVETPTGTETATATPAVETPKKTVEERMEEWKQNNPEPVRHTVEAPELTHNYDYKSILEKYQKDSQPDPKVEKQRKINQSIASAGDALAALINAVGTTAGGNNMKLDPASGLSEKMRARYKADDATAQDLRDKYLTLMLKAAGLEDADNNRKLSLYNSAVAKADTDYNTAKRNHDTAYDRQVRSYERQDAAEEKVKVNADNKAYKDKMITLREQQLEDNKDYHNKSLNIQQQRVNKAGKGNNEHFIIGQWRSNRTFSKEELATVASRMYEAGLISVGDWNSAEMGLKAYSPLIEKAARTKRGAEIMESNGFTKNK